MPAHPSIRRVLLACVVALPLAAWRHPLAVNTPELRADSTYAGLYDFGFEKSRFVACGRPIDDSPWWVVLAGTLSDRRDSLIALSGLPRGSTYFVRSTGAISAPGHVGHLGASRRYFVVRHIVELRAANDSDCVSPVRMTMPFAPARPTAPR